MVAALAENALTAILTVVSLALFLIALRSWRHVRSRKVLLLALAFGVLFAKAAFLSWGLFDRVDWERLIVPALVFDLAALALFYVAALR